MGEKRLEKTEARLEAKDEKVKELEGKVKTQNDELDKLRMEVPSNNSGNALANPSLRDLPIVIISAYRKDSITSSIQTVTFDRFLANFNNADQPGGGDADFDLGTGVFTCATPGYYSVSFSAYSTNVLPSSSVYAELYLFKNGELVPESWWSFAQSTSSATGGTNDYVGATCSRILILHMEAGAKLELKFTNGNWIRSISLNIELVGSASNYLV